MTDDSIYVETAPFWQRIECPYCGEMVPVLLCNEKVGGRICDECGEQIKFRYERRTESREDDTEQTTLVPDGGRPTGDLERFAIDQALRAAWDTEWWLPFDPEYGFIDYFEAAATRNLGLLRGFEELAEDAARRGILPQTDSEQAQLVTDGGQPVPEQIAAAIEASDYPELSIREVMERADLSKAQVVAAAGSMDRLELDRAVGVVRLHDDDGGEFVDDLGRDLVTDGGVPDPDDYRIPTIAELDAMRADANLSMRDLSRCAGFKDNRFSHILNNDVNAQTRTIRAFLTALQEFDGHTDTGEQGPDPTPSDLVDDDGPTEVDVEQIAARLQRLNADDVGEDPSPPEGDETLLTDGGPVDDTNSEGGVVDGE